MLTRGRIAGLVLVVAAAVTAALVWRLLVLRFGAGDVYPPYSSLRADPLGTRVLLDALAALPGVEARRNLREWASLPGGPGCVLIVAGLDRHGRRPADQWRDLQAVAAGGGRVVLALLGATEGGGGTPATAGEGAEGKKEDREAAGPAEPGPPVSRPPAAGPPEVGPEREAARGGEAGGDPGPARRRSSRRSVDGRDLGGDGEERLQGLGERWGLTVTYDAGTAVHRGSAGAGSAVRCPGAPPSLPAELPWHAWLYVEDGADGAPHWTPVYRRDGKAVVLVRRLGRGSVVLLTDSYLLSNEAMRAARQPELLSWLLAGARTVVFDETHLGVTESPGLVSLLRRHRLHGAGVGLLLLALLFVWRQTSSLVPPTTGGAGAAAATSARDSTAGLVALLRRSVPQGQILRRCVEEWAAAGARSRTAAAHAGEVCEQLAADERRPARDRDPAATYRAICKALRERRPHGGQPGR